MTRVSSKSLALLVFFIPACLPALILAVASQPIHASIPKPEATVDFPEGERIIYTRLVEAYRHNQLNEVVRNRQILEKNYPMSVHLDNAYYLTGKLQYQQDRLAEAVQSFAAVRARFERGNKRPSAMFGLAKTYQKLNLRAQSRRVLESILKEYPGSSEAHQAWMELELEKGKGNASAKTLKR